MTAREWTFGPYQIKSLIGRGGMGEVYRAYDTVHDRMVALKLLAAHLSTDDNYRARFRRECHLAARLREPHVIPIHSYGEHDGRLFLDMRLVEGRDLATILADEGRVEPATAVNLIGQVARALDAAHHDGLIHRDVKPSNVILDEGEDPDDDFLFAYLVDFGVARAVGDDANSAALTSTGGAVGTFDYMPPERFTGSQADRHADVYSLACMLYESLTGMRPFGTGQELAALMFAHMNTPPPKASEHAEVNSLMDDVIARGMAKDPAERYATASALASAARSALLGPGRRERPATGHGPLTAPTAYTGLPLTPPTSREHPPGTPPPPAGTPLPPRPTPLPLPGTPLPPPSGKPVARPGAAPPTPVPTPPPEARTTPPPPSGAPVVPASTPLPPYRPDTPPPAAAFTPPPGAACTPPPPGAAFTPPPPGAAFTPPPPGAGTPPPPNAGAAGHPLLAGGLPAAAAAANAANPDAPAARTPLPESPAGGATPPPGRPQPYGFSGPPSPPTPPPPRAYPPGPAPHTPPPRPATGPFPVTGGSGGGQNRNRLIALIALGVVAVVAIGLVIGLGAGGSGSNAPSTSTTPTARTDFPSSTGVSTAGTDSSALDAQLVDSLPSTIPQSDCTPLNPDQTGATKAIRCSGSTDKTDGPTTTTLYRYLDVATLKDDLQKIFTANKLKKASASCPGIGYRNWNHRSTPTHISGQMASYFDASNGYSTITWDDEDNLVLFVAQSPDKARLPGLCTWWTKP